MQKGAKMGGIRKRMLPAGWYPKSEAGVQKVFQDWEQSVGGTPSKAVSCIVPHAGWDFSGELAFLTLRCLSSSVDTIAVVGGHLPARPAVLVTTADKFETPLGFLETDRELLKRVCNDIDYEEDLSPDNTVEIQLPLIKYLFPGTRILALRVSPTAEATLLGKKLYALSRELGRRIAVVGSTDLTHYGAAYGFSPAGRGKGAIDWVRDENDKHFLDKALSMDGESAIDHANSHRSACSAGAAAAAIAFAGEMGITTGRLIGYRMSCEVHMAESFVGYGGIIYAP